MKPRKSWTRTVKDGNRNGLLLYRLRGQLHFQRREDVLALTDLETAKQLFVEVFPAYQLPRSHPLLIMSLTSLVDSLNYFARSDAAIKLAEEALKECGRHYQGAAHERRSPLCSVTAVACAMPARSNLPRFRFGQPWTWQTNCCRRGVSQGALLLACVGCTLAACWQDKVSYRQAPPLLRECACRCTSRVGIHTIRGWRRLGSLALRQGNQARPVCLRRGLKADQQQLRQFGLMAAQIETLTFSQQAELACTGVFIPQRNGAALDEHAYKLGLVCKGAITRLEQVKCVAGARLDERPAGSANPRQVVIPRAALGGLLTAPRIAP